MTDTQPAIAAPLSPRPETLDFLLTRRSRPPKTLGLPVPDRSALAPLLLAAARVPDHGKLEPWRFVVLERAACERLAALTAEIGPAEGRDADALAKDVASFADAHLVVAVVLSPKPADRIPQWEQEMSAGAVCLSLVNACLAAGWGAGWLTGWRARNRAFCDRGLDLADHESVAGFVHIGTETRPPQERPRPDMDAITTWMAE
ncbi:nitroreductase family protein [Roseibacterium sp. SDUM158017]|uniref:nitroreductase family protein n=1 Tax=Roseicyclus salinarum TaxID=3036773 RepID=UPI00241568C8|nr:nitroreductase family protein [Roseibacterium sp. SDUM158017]MDG4648577.1 nitroreductase family protein [Roseibacterium sp. SDUM158017]